MSFDPFRPDDAGDASAFYSPKASHRLLVRRLIVALSGLALLAVAALVASLVA